MKLVKMFAVAIAMFGLVSGAMAAEWDAGGGEAWEKMLEAGRAEGSVVVAGTPAISKEFAEAFEEDTGIAVNYISGGFRDLLTRAFQESDAGKPTYDVYLGGASHLFLMRKGALAPVATSLVLPSVTDPSNWRDGEIVWLDNEKKYLFQPNEYVSGRVLINTQAIDPDTINTWDDLLDPSFKGKMTTQDPLRPGAGQAAAAWLLDEKGAEFMTKLFVGQEVKYTAEQRQLVEWVVRGVHPIGLGAIVADVERFRDAGVDYLVMKEMEDASGFTAGGVAIPAVLKGSPNPNAAMVFLNWYLSPRAQKIYTDAMQVPSRRTDVDNSAAPEYTFPNPGKTYPNGYLEDWYVKERPRTVELLKENLASN